MDKSDTVVKVENVTFGYGGVNTLENINLEIHKGDFVGLIGPNGSGKTTLAKIILGLLKPKNGTVELFGTEVKKFDEWKKLGYVPQKAGSEIVQFPVTTEEVVGMEGVSKSSVDWALDLVEMKEFSKKLISQLSGGQQQRVFIARALVKKPKLLILDEPTAGVDIESQSRFYDLLKKLNKEHQITLVLVSHDIDVVAHEVTHVICVNKTIILHGKPHDVLKDDFLKRVYGQNLKAIIHGH